MRRPACGCILCQVGDPALEVTFLEPINLRLLRTHSEQLIELLLEHKLHGAPAITPGASGNEWVRGYAPRRLSH